MPHLQIEDRRTPLRGVPLLRLAFRPFFLLAGISAVCLIAYWVYLLNRGGAASSYGSLNWHAHEMVFGYTVAVIAGFLLTAEKNWTNVQTLHGPWLGIFALIWLAGRIAPWLALPAWLIAVIDLAFLPVLAVVLLIPLIRTSQYQHLVFVGITVILFIANLLFHVGHIYPEWKTSGIGIRLGWMTVVFLITVMGGRVIPFFIERGTRELAKTKTYRPLELAAIISLLSWAVAALVAYNSIYTAALACIAGCLQLLRWWGWHLRALWRVPMLWILFLGYAWIPIGLFLFAYAGFSGHSASAALHAFTAGAIGVLTIGMMARVSLGHTGRTIEASTTLTLAFIFVTLGSLVRVAGPLLLPAWAVHDYALIITVAGVLWVFGFLLFVMIYLPVLTQSRVDGRPG